MGFLYFAYGSNLLSHRLLHPHNTTKSKRGIGKLQDFQLTFASFYCQSWSGNPATIDRVAGASVWGVVWEIDDEDRPLLDRQERSYRPINIEVEMSTGEVVDCLTYEILPEIKTDSGFPSPFYLDILQRGARQNSLPLLYRDWLENHPHNNIKTPVPPKYFQIMELIQDDQTCNQNLEKFIT